MDVVQILVVLAVIGFSIYNKVQREPAKKKPVKPAGPPPIVPQSAPEAVGPVAQRAGTFANEEAVATPSFSRVPVQPSAPGKAGQPAGAPSAMPQDEPAGQVPPIRLDDPSEARRAFIYSEIFHRKY